MPSKEGINSLLKISPQNGQLIGVFIISMLFLLPNISVMMHIVMKKLKGSL